MSLITKWHSNDQLNNGVLKVADVVMIDMWLSGYDSWRGYDW
jgi:hypothetical protein